jgi:hypothetical protein
MRSVEKRSDVIVEGTFIIDSEEAGRGRIIPKDVLKGAHRREYPVHWNSHAEDTLPPSELDCLVVVPATGTFEGFNLVRDGKSYAIIGRWEPVKKVR